MEQGKMTIEAKIAPSNTGVWVGTDAQTMEDFSGVSAIAIDGLMGIFERKYPSKAACVAFGASLIETIKTHEWNWERSEK